MQPVVILNREAGSVNGDRDAVTADAVREAFAAHDVPVEVSLADPARLKHTLLAAIATRPPAIIVGGGDGTISTAAAALVGTDIPLGVIPLGTLNHFACDLRMPKEWREAVASLASGQIRRVDVAEVNGCIFINNCSIGSYPEAVRHRDKLRREQGRTKWFAMAVASFRVFRRLRRFRVRIEIPDTTLLLRTPFVFVGNNRYSGHLMDYSLRPRLDEGALSIFTTRMSGHFGIIRLMWQSLLHNLDAAEGLDTRVTTEAVISSPFGQTLPVAVDGELANLQPPFRFRVRPLALTVIGPNESSTTPGTPWLHSGATARLPVIP